MLLIAIAWHTLMHPAVGATNEYTRQLIQTQATAWFVLHMFSAIAAALFAAAAVAMIGGYAIDNHPFRSRRMVNRR